MHVQPSTNQDTPKDQSYCLGLASFVYVGFTVIDYYYYCYCYYYGGIGCIKSTTQVL